MMTRKELETAKKEEREIPEKEVKTLISIAKKSAAWLEEYEKLLYCAPVYDALSSAVSTLGAVIVEVEKLIPEEE